MITRKSTIEQHRGTHPETGLRITELHDVVTEYNLDASDPAERAWVAAVHQARVRLESLDAEPRRAAYDWLATHDHDGHDEADAYRQAIAETATSLYAADRSPSGHATALLCTLVDGRWGHTSETGTPGQRVELGAGEPLYATQDEAIAAARRRWHCDVPRGQVFCTWIPKPVLVTGDRP